MNRKGFTLIELLGVIIILALLMTFAFPKILNAIKSSDDKVNELSIDLIGNAVDLFIDDNINDYSKDVIQYIPLKNLVDEGYLKRPIKLNSQDVDVTDLKIVEVDYKAQNKYNIINIEDTPKLCRKSDAVDLEDIKMGDVFTCTLDNNSEFDFYVLDNSNKENITLIMKNNYYDDTVPATMSWCDQAGDSSDNTACNHDGIDPYLTYLQETYGSKVLFSLPSIEQIAIASEIEFDNNFFSGLPEWLYTFSDEDLSVVSSYWTLSPEDSSHAWGIWFYDSAESIAVDDEFSSGMRPTITLSKYLLY